MVMISVLRKVVVSSVADFELLPEELSADDVLLLVLGELYTEGVQYTIGGAGVEIIIEVEGVVVLEAELTSGVKKDDPKLDNIDAVSVTELEVVTEILVGKSLLMSPAEVDATEE